MVERKGLSGTLVVLAGIASIMVPIALVYRQPHAPPRGLPQEKPSIKSWRVLDFTLLKDKSFVILLIGVSLYATGAFIPASHAVSFFSLC